jgi:hypothetical protein
MYVRMLYVCMHACMHVCMYVCMYACMFPSCSGRFNTAFSFQNRYTKEEFLGEYIDPSDLTPDAAEKQGSTEGSYTKAIADSTFHRAFLKELAQDLGSLDFLRVKDTEKVRAWSETVGSDFLAPFGPNSFALVQRLRILTSTQSAPPPFPRIAYPPPPPKHALTPPRSPPPLPPSHLNIALRLPTTSLCYTSGVGNAHSAYCLSGREKLTKEATSAPTVYTACSDPCMPFPVIVGCVAPKVGPKHGCRSTRFYRCAYRSFVFCVLECYVL